MILKKRWIMEKNLLKKTCIKRWECFSVLLLCFSAMLQLLCICSFHNFVLEYAQPAVDEEPASAEENKQAAGATGRRQAVMEKPARKNNGIQEEWDVMEIPENWRPLPIIRVGRAKLETICWQPSSVLFLFKLFFISRCGG